MDSVPAPSPTADSIASVLLSRAWRPALVVLAVAGAVMAAVFFAEIRAAVTVWTQSATFQHCYLILPIAAFLAWERRGALGGLVPAPLPWLALLALPAAAVWLVASRLGLMEGRQLVVLGMVWLLVLAVLGWRICRVMAVPLAYLVFLVPFGAFLTPALQDITARFIDVSLELLRIPHVVTDTLIEIPEGHFRVAEACAGLRFLIAAVACGTLYACMIYRSPGRRVAFIAVSIAVPVLANGVRALAIVVLGHELGSAEAGAVDHVLYGWIFFSLVLLLLGAMGLPFRQDGEVFAPAAKRRILSPGPLPRPFAAAGIAALLLVSLASIGPGAAAWLDARAAGETAALDERAARIAATMVIPAGCDVVMASPGVRRVSCGGRLLEMRIRVFGRLAGPQALAAFRDATQWGSEDDAEIERIETEAGRWALFSTQDPQRSVAAAMWLDGSPAPGGLTLRRRLATGDVAQTTLMTVGGLSSPDGVQAPRDVIADFVRVQPGPVAP